MLAIRMQRLGRKGHPTYRVVVQDSRSTPTSGKFVALLGSYDPHTKTTTLVKEKAEFYLKNGAQPSDRVASLFQSEGVKLPSWVKIVKSKTKTTKSPEKLRKNRPEEPKEEVVEAEAPKETSEVAVETASVEASEEVAEVPAEEPKVEAEEVASEKEAETAEEEPKKD